MQGNCFLASKFGLSFVPFYVGKGQGNRWLDFNRNDSHRKIRSTLVKQNKDIHSVKVVENLTEGQALSIESKLIDILGLKSISPHGLLVNLDEGKDALIRRKNYSKGVLSIVKKNGFVIS